MSVQVFPNVEELEEEEKADTISKNSYIVKKSGIKHKARKYTDPTYTALASFLKSHITGKRNKMKPVRYILIKKLDLGISYQDINNLLARWTLL